MQMNELLSLNPVVNSNDLLNMDIKKKKEPPSETRFSHQFRQYHHPGYPLLLLTVQVLFFIQTSF